MKQRICRAGLPAVSAISTCGNTGEGNRCARCVACPVNTCRYSWYLSLGAKPPPTPRRTCSDPPPCCPTSSIDDLARTDLTYRSCWLGISDPGLAHKVRRKTAGGSGHPGGTTVRGSAARGRRRPGPGPRWVVAGVFAGSGLIEMATAWPMSATVASVSHVFAASRVSTRPAAARVARSGWSPGGGGPAAVGVVVMF